jgi:hypothetical protein
MAEDDSALTKHGTRYIDLGRGTSSTQIVKIMTHRELKYPVQNPRYWYVYLTSQDWASSHEDTGREADHIETSWRQGQHIQSLKMVQVMQNSQT